MRQRVLTAYYDDNTGELVDIDWSRRFSRESVLMKLDVLEDLTLRIGDECGDALIDSQQALADLGAKP